METTAAKNYLENTNLKFKFKAGAAIGTAAYLLILVLIEEIAGVVLPSFLGDIYLIGGIALMVITGSIFKALKVAKGVFKWGYLLTPFVLFDVVIADDCWRFCTWSTVCTSVYSDGAGYT